MYFAFPFDDKSSAKAMGARWDSAARKWYAPTPKVAEGLRTQWNELSETSLQLSKPPPCATEEAPAEASARTYFRVPFSEKDVAKACGGRWDPHARQWYAPTQAVATVMGRTWKKTAAPHSVAHSVASRSPLTVTSSDPSELFRVVTFR